MIDNNEIALMRIAVGELCPNLFFVTSSFEVCWKATGTVVREKEWLDAMREAVLTLSAVNHPDKDGFDWSEHCEYLKQLEAIVFKATGKAECQFEIVNATALQRLEAFLRTHGRNVEIEK